MEEETVDQAAVSVHKQQEKEEIEKKKEVKKDTQQYEEVEDDRN